MSHILGDLDEPTIEALEALGNVLRELRGQRGLSQRSLAARCGLSQSTISRLECGLAAGVRVGWLARLLAGLDQDIPWPGHEPWNIRSSPGWAILLERFRVRGRLAARLIAESERARPRPKGGHPYRKRPTPAPTEPADAATVITGG